MVRPVQMPWPISECPSNTVTLLSLPMRRKAFGANTLPWACAPMANRCAPGMTNATTSPPPSQALPLRKPRRDNLLMLLMATSTQLGGALDRGANPRISAAAADVAGQCLINVVVGRFRDLRQQRRRRHDLPGLAVA